MARNHGEPVSAMLALQRELENRFASDWMGGGTSAIGDYPQVNMFLQGDDFVAVIELPGIGKDDLAIEANELTLRIFGKKRATYDQRAIDPRRRPDPRRILRRRARAPHTAGGNRQAAHDRNQLRQGGRTAMSEQGLQVQTCRRR